MVLTDRIKKSLQKNCHTGDGDTVIVGVSGGPDSLALLHILCQLDLHLTVVAVYVDHGLRPEEAVAEKRLVARQANELGAAFESVTVDVHAQKKKLKTSTEEAARIVRYEALEKVRNEHNAQAIAVGHTADDQAEELLIRLIRGSGSAGLGGMKSRQGFIVRPLLAERKESLINYLQKQNIEYCQDSSNLDRSFLRNRIRLDLLPYLEDEFNPSIRETLLQTAAILHAEDSFLDRLTKESFDHVVRLDHGTNQVGTPCPKCASVKPGPFQHCHKAIQRRILEKLCRRMEARPNFKLIEQLLHLICTGRNGSEVHLEKGLRAVKINGTVNFSHPAGITPFRGSGVQQPIVIRRTIEDVGDYVFPELNMTLSLNIYNEQPKEIDSSTLMVDADRVTFPLVLRTQHTGEKFRPLGSPGRKKVARFLSDQKIPKNRRSLYPVLLSENIIVTLVGLQIDDDFRVSDTTKKFLVIDWKDSPSKAKKS